MTASEISFSPRIAIFTGLTWKPWPLAVRKGSTVAKANCC